METLKIEQQESSGIWSKIKTAREELAKLAERRRVSFDAYRRAPIGTEQDGRSDYQSSIVMDQVEGATPALMGRVLATDHKIRAKGPDPLIAKALIVKAREEIGAQNSFWLYSCVIKDGLLSVMGTAKLWWSKTWKTIVQRAECDGEKLKALEMMAEAGEIDKLVAVQRPPEQATYDPGDGITPPMELESSPIFDCEITLTAVDKSGVVVVPIPPEQVLIEKGKSHVNDGRGIGHQVTMTVGELIEMHKRLSLPDEPYFDEEQLALGIARGAVDEGSSQKSEREGREDLNFTRGADGRIDFNLTADKLRRPVTVTEWSDTVISGGASVPAIVWYVSDVNVRVEHNKDGIVPFSLWSPYLVPHSMAGLGVAEQHVYNQDLKTTAGRSLVLHVARSVDEETYVINPGTDILGLRRRAPGDMIYAEPDKDFKRGESNSLDSKLFQMMDWLGTEAQENGPSNRWTMGGDVDPRNTTATGQQIMSRASTAKQNMIALVFTEMFQVDLYQKIIRLLQRHVEPFDVVVEGQTLHLTREDIQGDYVAYSEVGRQFDINGEEVQSSLMLLEQLTKLVPSGIVTPQNIYNAAKRVVLAFGESNVSDYLTPPAAVAPDGLPGSPTVPDQASGGFDPGVGAGGGFQ